MSSALPPPGERRHRASAGTNRSTSNGIRWRALSARTVDGWSSCCGSRARGSAPRPAGRDSDGAGLRIAARGCSGRIRRLRAGAAGTERRSTVSPRTRTASPRIDSTNGYQSRIRATRSGGSSVINDTFARLESSFDRLRRFTADASHEFRTPLAVIRGIGEVGLGEPRSPAEYQEAMGSMLEEVDRLTSWWTRCCGCRTATQEPCASRPSRPIWDRSPGSDLVDHHPCGGASSTL